MASAANSFAIIAGTLGQGGAERQLCYITTAVKSLGYTPLVLSLTSGEYYEEILRDDGVEVINVLAAGKLGRLKEIAGILRTRDLVALMSMHFFTNLYAAFAGKLIGMKAIGAIRNDYVSEEAKGGFLGKLSLTMPNVIGANSHLGIENAVKAGRARSTLHYLPNVVDTDYYYQKSPVEVEGPIVLAFAGRLDKNKRADRFIRLVEKLSHEIDVIGHIYGTGVLEADLKQQASDLGLAEDCLNFKGLTSDMREAYNSANILVLTSDHEGTPNVVLEAQACGLPVIATDVGGVPNIIQHNETGIIVTATDEDRLYEETLSLARNPEKRSKLSQQARLFVEEEHGLKRLARSVEELLASVR